MTTYTVYVKSPISGAITGRDNYCINNDNVCTGSGANHGSCAGGSSRVDIAGTGVVYLRVSYPNVKSIKTLVGNYCCGGTNCADNFRRAIKVELYGGKDATCYYMGSVLYGHISAPEVENGRIYNLTSGSKRLGTVTVGACANCSTGAHIHMERFNGSVVAPCCGVTVGSAHNIYKFTWSDNIPC